MIACKIPIDNNTFYFITFLPRTKYKEVKNAKHPIIPMMYPSTFKNYFFSWIIRLVLTSTVFTINNWKIFFLIGIDNYTCTCYYLIVSEFILWSNLMNYY